MNVKIEVDFDQKTGKRVMPLHGFNSGPMTKVFTYDARRFFVEGGFPYVRLHDVEYPYGSGEFVDIPCIFKNFDADENDPASYNFGNTDEYIRHALSVGAKIIYRLGVSIEHSPVKRYIHPPKDFAKWARICEHIIRHYNEGWANGYHWNIEYWEIWNEADIDRKGNNKRCWSGTCEQFVQLYATAATYLKNCFPHLKIGGCGFTGPTNEFIEPFFEKLSTYSPRVPMDFYSWHCYTYDPAIMVEKARLARSVLQRFGYDEAESILDEWNLIYGMEFERQAESYRAMKDHRGAAFYAAFLCAMQEHTDICIATNFEADVVKEYCGIFTVKNMCIGGLSQKCMGRRAELAPTKGFFAFKAYHSLYRLGNQAFLQCDTPNIYATAACGDSGVGVLAANCSEEEAEVTFDLKGITEPVVLRITDAFSQNIILPQPFTADERLDCKIVMPANSFLYLGTELSDPIFDLEQRKNQQ